MLTFGAGRPRLLPPRGSRPGVVALRRVLAEGVAPDGVNEPHALAHALGRVGRVARQPGFVAVISDFREQHGWTRAARRARARATPCSPSRSRDPREAELPGRRAPRRSSIPRRASASRSTPRARACASASPTLERERREARRARPAPAARRPRRAVHRSRLAARPRAEAAVSFAAPVWLLGLAAGAAGAAGLPSPAAGAAAATRCASPPCPRCSVAAGAVPAWRRHLPGGAGPGGARRARAGAGQAADDGRGARRARVDHARHRPLALDVGRPTSSPTRLAAAAARGAHVPRPAARARCASAPSPSPTRPTPSRRRAPTTTTRAAIVDGQVADGATATGDALAGRHRRCSRRRRTASARRRRSSCSPTARPRAAATRSRSPARPGAAEDPDLHGRPRHAATPRCPTRTRSARRCSSRPTPRRCARSPRSRAARAFTAEDSDSLSSIYKTLGSQLGTKTQKKQITATFAIGGLVLLLGAAFSSLRWAGRLP